MMGKPVILVGKHYWQRYNWWDTLLHICQLVSGKSDNQSNEPLPKMSWIRRSTYGPFYSEV